MLSQKVVVVIPIRNDGFLMVYNPRRGWEFPGGKIEIGENIFNAAKRECKEEAGIIVENIVKLGEEGNIIFLAGEIKYFLKDHQFERSFFDSIPNRLAFSRNEAKKYITSAFVKLRGYDVIEGKL